MLGYEFKALQSIFGTNSQRSMLSNFTINKQEITTKITDLAQGINTSLGFKAFQSDLSHVGKTGLLKCTN